MFAAGEGGEMMRIPFQPAFYVLILGSMTAVVWAQDSAPPKLIKSRLQVSAVSAYFDYYSSGVPANNGFLTATKLLADADAGASIQIGWLKSTDRSSSSLTYTSSYNGRVRYSELNSWNHAFSLATGYKLSSRVNFGFSASGDLSSVAQSLFSPTALASAASVPATFDDLAAALLTSRFTNPQLASALAGASLAESPVRNLLYGERVLTSGVQTSLSYSYSPRLTLMFHVGAGRMQPLAKTRPETGNRPLLPNTTSVNANIAVSYSLSPRAQLGGSVATSRVVSSLQDAYITTALLNLGWTVSRQWFLQAHVGAGVTNQVRRQLVVFQPVKPRPALGAGLGYKTLSHTFLGSFDRTVSDQYGLGASLSSSAGASWRWDRPARHWWVESGLTWQQLHANGFLGTTGWRATAGFGQRIGEHFAILTEYAYMDYSGVQTIRYDLSQSALRISAVWYPNPQISR
jgi:hypothetical protein